MPWSWRLIGLDLLDQADAAAFLRQIDEHARPLLADHLHGDAELVAAVATQRSQQVAGETGRVQPHQRLGRLGRVAHDDGDRLLLFIADAEGDDASRAETRGQIGLGHAIDQLFAAAAIADQFLDADDLQAVLLGQGVELLAGGAVAVGVENFAKHAGRRQAGHARQIDGRFGMTGPPQARRPPWPPRETGARDARNRSACSPDRRSPESSWPALGR